MTLLQNYQIAKKIFIDVKQCILHINLLLLSLTVLKIIQKREKSADFQGLFHHFKMKFAMKIELQYIRLDLFY